MQLSAFAMASSAGLDLDMDAAAAASRSELNGNANATTTTTTTTTKTTPRKEKTILGWLVKSASVNDKSNDNDSQHDQHNDNNNCNCETRAFRDFRGVQTLRLLWSKRIQSAASEEAAAAKQRGAGTGLGTLRKLNKSVSCLVNAFNNARDWPSQQNAHETRAKRAASLHNLHETATTTTNQKQIQLQRDKDNFNKYKNAEQAKMQSKQRRSSVEATALATFPAVKAAAGERLLQWPKRVDVKAKTTTTARECLSDNENAHELAEQQKELENANENLISLAAQPTLAATVVISLSATCAHSGSNETLNSINSNTTTTTTTTVTSQTQQRSTPRRKYSFKTHAGKSYHQHHTPRRMSTTHSHHSQSQSHSQNMAVAGEALPSAASVSSNVSLVRQLTQQFNEFIQKDARLLEQVKRKNGVWLSRGSHVYKIVEKPVAQQQQQQQSQQAAQLQRSSSVQRTIKKFEKLEKPAVPLKPTQLRPSTLSLSKQMRSKRAKQQQLLEQQQQQLQQQREQQLQQQRQQTQLEVLREGPKLRVKLPASSDDEGVQIDEDDATKPKAQATVAAPSTENLNKQAELETETEADAERQKQRKHKYATIYEKLRFKKKASRPTKLKIEPEMEQQLETQLEKEKELQLKTELENEKELQLKTELEKQMKLQLEQKLKPNLKTETELELKKELKLETQLELKKELKQDTELELKKELKLELVTELERKLKPELKLETHLKPEAKQETEQLSPCVEADYKILAALEVLDKKLKVLAEPATMEQGELLLVANDDFEQRLLPNSSFIYQAANKQVCNNQLLLNQAVNVTLVNAYEGEQMIMEQKQLKEQRERERDQLDCMYEPITPTKENESKTEPQTSSLFKLSKQKEQATTEDIYQTVEEATTAATTAKARTTSASWLQDYESIAGSCEAGNRRNSSNNNDDYEAFAAPAIPEEPATPTATTTTVNSTGTLGRNTRDELPELPKPQRILSRSPNILRPAPAKPQQVSRLSVKAKPCPNSTDEEDENIYDTIKGCYESMQTKDRSKVVNSLSSNCYESISNYRNSKATAAINTAATVAAVPLSSSGSSLTISSDHRTNSIYESSLAAGVIYGSASVGCRSSLASSAGSGSSRGNSKSKQCDKRSSIAGSSDNSDAWVDISDGEATAAATATGESQFIVVRERFKQHRVRSPDWSKRIRDKRLQQNKAKSCIEDDSDHYYETLAPLGNKRHSTQLLPGQHQPRGSQRRSKQHSASAHALGQHAINSDDYDSFETDSDEQTEQEQRLQHHNDSGVDMRNHRLPDPPAPQNQVYAIVRKFKDFISNKKSPKGSQLKLYENTQQASSNTQFYVECKKQQDVYDHATPLSSSEKNLVASQSPSQSQQEQPTTPSLLRPKPKNGKSLRSRLRKSLVGASFDHKQLSTLTPTRSTFYIEDPPPQQQLEHAHHGSGELDSGFSEKANSGDLPVPSAESQKFSTVARKAKKESKALRRRTMGGVRPHEPPPPPPEQRNRTTLESNPPTSWYAECGVFKQSTTTQQANDEPTTPTPNANGSSWYAESGLYQTSGISVASSSGSSGVSTGNEAGLGDDLQPHSLFSNEPLYQVYSAAKLESITRDLEAQESSTDGYEEIGLHAHSKTQPAQQLKTRPTALQLVEPKNGPSRTLWSEVPEVIHSCILPTLTPRERGLQEAKFEIMTSEASYLKSLNLLRRHFMNNAAFCDSAVLSTRDRKSLFSYIVPVHECSERLLTELESCWQNNIMLLGLSRRIYEIAERHFHVYITFCEHQGRMDRTLRRLKESKNGSFQQQLDKLEANPSCCGLNLHSFLMLPMQRITRLPLLIDAVFSKESPHNGEEYDSWKLTLALVQKIVSQCNEAANRWEQAYELERISKQLEFPSYIRALAIAPMGVPKQGAKPRFLVKRGELTHLIWRGDDAKLTFGKRFSKCSIYAFLFSDLLVLCKRKGESNFTVFDYCPRSMLTLAAGDTLPQLPTKDIKDPISKNLMLMTLLENYERKTIELVLSCPSVSDQQRWLEAMRPPEAETPGEKLYESWDCPQVITKHSYESDEPDVLQLELGDVVNVSRKLPDGWYQGERIRDGAVGWFPGSYTEELNSSHVRSRNLKQRHRLLTFTATYLEAQKGK